MIVGRNFEGFLFFSSPPIAFLVSLILPPLDTLSMTEEMCFLSLTVSLGASSEIGVAPWFSLPGLAREVRSKKVRAASVVSSQPWFN